MQFQSCGLIVKHTLIEYLERTGLERLVSTKTHVLNKHCNIILLLTQDLCHLRSTKSFLVTSRLRPNFNCSDPIAGTKEQLTSKAVSHLKINEPRADQFSTMDSGARSFATKPQRMKEDLQSGSPSDGLEKASFS